MREIEIKVRLQDKEGLLAALAGKGVALGEPVHQRDQVFGLPGEAGGDGNTVPFGCGCAPRRVDKAKMKPSGRYSL